MAKAAETQELQVAATPAPIPLQTQLIAAAAARGISPEAWHVLKTSIYRGSSDAMICTVIDYCKARKLDPMKKPFHIVKVWDGTAKKEIEGIWPSIGETRTTATRTTEYGGISDVRHGETITRKIAGIEVTFPEWAQYSVFRHVKGEFREFAGPRVYWMEEFAEAKGGKPNYMWAKRPFGQANKCAEAAALRAAFPEECSSDPTAEEIEGKTINGTLEDVTPAKRDGNASMAQFGGASTAPATAVLEHQPETVIDVDGVVIEPEKEKVKVEATPASNGNGNGDHSGNGNNMIIKVYASADEPERPIKTLSNALYVIRGLIKDAKTPALAKTIFDMNIPVLSRLPKESADTVEEALNKRMKEADKEKGGDDGEQGALV